MNLRHALSPTNLALVAVFAGLIAASTIWPGAELVSGVPITLQTLAILLAGAALGPWRGASAVILYLVVGTAGAPIFAGRSAGPAVWTGPTAGFLAGFVVAAFVAGWLVRRMRRRSQLTVSGVIGACAVASLLVLNLIGWGFFMVRLGATATDTIVFATPFLVGDIIKVFVAGVTAAAVHRAYPGLLGGPVAPPEAATTEAPVSPAAMPIGSQDAS